MNAVTGGFVGALVTGLAVFGWQGRPATHLDASAPPAAAAVRLVSDTQAFGPTTPAAFASPVQEVAPVSVRCEPGQRALLRQVSTLNGQSTTEAGCVSDGYAVAMPSAGVIDPTAPRPIRYVSAQRSGAERVVYRERGTRYSKPARSWQKRALVIGGSAGAGAGIGAIAGGKKGALLGAAIGGGAGTVYELLHK